MSEQGLTGIAALEAEMRDRLAAKDATIAELQATVQRFTENLESARITSDRQEDHVIAGHGRIAELEAALGEAEGLLCRLIELEVHPARERHAQSIADKIRSLCHADASRADSPHRADGALQTSSEKDA